jgi:putative transposase
MHCRAMDKLRSYTKPTKPTKQLGPNSDHRAHKGLNNLIEVSHRPPRKREKLMGRFKFTGKRKGFYPLMITLSWFETKPLSGNESI